MMLSRTIALLIALPLAVNAAPVNYCQDPETERDWQALLEKNRGDQQIMGLYHLRDSLCGRVDKGELSLGQVTEIFETERQRIIEERLRHNEELERKLREEDPTALTG